MTEETKRFLEKCFQEASPEMLNPTLSTREAKNVVNQVKRDTGAYLERLEKGCAIHASKLRNKRY